ncbi:hypothetical protein B0H14DRAFT_2828751, partial [Mycena olivaceomarginata]
MLQGEWFPFTGLTVLQSSKCYCAKLQYYANVCLMRGPSSVTSLVFAICSSRSNVKLSGIDTIPDPSSVSVLTDPHNPTIFMGAFVSACLSL